MENPEIDSFEQSNETEENISNEGLLKVTESESANTPETRLETLLKIKEQLEHDLGLLKTVDSALADAKKERGTEFIEARFNELPPAKDLEKSK